MGKESVTQRRQKETSNKKHMLGGRHIQFPLERGRGSHKEQGNKVDTFLQLILPVILYCDFCFDPETGCTPLLPLWNPVTWQFSLGKWEVLKMTVRVTPTWNTHTWYWRRHLWSGARLRWLCSVQRTQSFLHPAADPQQWTWGCCLPGSASRCLPWAGHWEASCNWCQPDRWPRSVAWRCGRAEHPGTWAPWWTGLLQPGWTELEKEAGETEGK